MISGAHDQAIVAEAETADAGLVVIGQHRKDILLDLFRGSTGERVIRFGGRPVPVVKSAATRRYHDLLVAVDFSPPCRRAIEMAVKLVSDADIRLLHAFDIPFRNVVLGSSTDQIAKKHQRQYLEMVEAQTREFLQTLSIPIEPRQVIARDGRPEDTIIAVVEEMRPDLLVVGTHGRSGLGRALIGSVAEGVIARASCDVLAVRGW